MRLSTSQIYDKGLSSVIDRQNKLVKVQDQIARETKILTPADDPAGKAQTLALTDRIKQNEQFQKNSQLVLNDLSRQESVLKNVTDSLFRAKELFVQAGNGAYDFTDRQSLALEIEVLRDNVLDMMNAQSENGDFLFSGYQTEQIPFTFDDVTGVYQYQGDNGAKKVQVTPSLQLQSSTSGAEAFQKTPVQLNARPGNVSGDLTGASTLIADRDLFNQFHANNYDKQNPANNVYTVEFNGGDFTVLDAQGNALQTGAYTPGEAVEFNGMQLFPQGDATDGSTVEFRLGQPQQNIATVLNDMVNALNDPNLNEAQLAQAIEFGLADLASAETSLGSVRARTGSRMNSAETAILTNTDFEIANKETRSRIQDVDYAEAMTELIKQDIALQAAQATFTRITRLSLFDYLR
ncbi:MAG: flagellar hook-associated protein FlgL [Firmicutes bacterium]|nr:flagellar hook-associated protein FlgL [Gammaproteobacteria bacterium]MCL5049662.1 flagellar hook-associated protein FlgL [Bacillota bacterium]